MVADLTRDGLYATPMIDSLTEAGAEKSRPMKAGEVVMAVSGAPGLAAILSVDACIHDGFVGFRKLSQNVVPEYLVRALAGYAPPRCPSSCHCVACPDYLEVSGLSDLLTGAR
jgi:hypothetical protein